MDLGRLSIFVDGENISTRYHEMVKQGRKPKKSNVLIEKCFVWSQSILEDQLWDLKRINYYTSITGSEDKISEIEKSISSVKYNCKTQQIFTPKDGTLFHTAHGRMIPCVSKRNGNNKESICDIALAVDVLRSCYRDHVDKVWIMSGDGDFLSLYKEVMHSGKQAIVSAFSSGLNPKVPMYVDEFFSLDEFFFDD